MNRKDFDAIKHGEPIEHVRVSAPQVAEFVVHEATAPDEHRVAAASHDTYAVAEENMGKSIGFIAVEGGEGSEQPTVHVAKHPSYPHMDKALINEVVPIALEHSGFHEADPADVSIIPLED